MDEHRFDETEEKSVYGEEAHRFLLDSSHFVLFIETREDGEYVHHSVGFHEEPNEASIIHLVEEVRDDPEFGLGDLMDKLEVAVVSDPEAVEYIKTELLQLKDAEYRDDPPT